MQEIDSSRSSKEGIRKDRPDEGLTRTSRSSSRRKQAAKRRKRRLQIAAALVLVVPFIVVLLWVLLTRPGASSEFYEKAIQQFDSRDFAGSIVSLERALQADRRDLSARILIGRAYLEMGNPDGAIKALRQALAEGADQTLVMLPLAQAFYDSGDFKSLFDDIPDEFEDSLLEAETLVLKSRARLQLRELSPAERGFDRAAKLAPKAPGPLIGKAMAALRRGKFETGTEFAEKAIALAPEDAEGWFAKAEIARAQTRKEQALEYLKKAIELDPNHHGSRLSRATLLIDANQDQPALDDLNYVWETRPDDPQANYLYALILSKLNQNEQAEKVLNKAAATLVRYRTEHVLRHAPSLLLQSVMLFKRERFDEAYPLLDRYIELEPHHTGARKLMGTLLLMRDLPTGAIEVLKPSLHGSANDPELLSLLSQAYLMRGDAELSTKLLNRAMELAPANNSLKSQLALSRLTLAKKAEDEFDYETALSLGEGAEGGGVLVGLLQLKRGNLAAATKTAETLVAQRPDNPGGHNLLGAAHLAAGERNKARDAFKKALELEPGHINANLNLAKLDGQSGNFEAASKRYEAIAQAAPKDLRPLVGLASIAQKTARYAEAADWMRKASVLDPDRLSLQLELVNLYLKARMYTEAKQSVDILAEQFPRSVPVRIAKGRVELESGNQKGALAMFRQLSNEAPESAERLLRIADYQRISNDVEGARATIAKAVDIDPTNLAVHTAKVRLDILAGKHELALSSARQLVHDMPHDAGSHALLGEVFTGLNRHDEAARAYATGMDRGGSHELIKGLFEAQWATGEHVKAVKSLELWTDANPNDLESRRILGSALMNVGRFNDARKLYGKLLDAYPDDPVVLSNAAILFLKSGTGDARSLAERAYRLAPTNPEVLDTLGWVMVHDDEAKSALKYLREAHSRDASVLKVRFHIGVALARLGRTQEAKRELRRVLEFDRPFDGDAHARRLLADLGG